MSDITLSAGVRTNLLTLQNTADMMATNADYTEVDGVTS